MSLTRELASVTRRLAMPAGPATNHTERRIMAVTTWVVVADGSRARIFETRGLKLDLREIEDLVNVVPGGRTLSEKEREKFARTVADYIEQGRLHQRYQRLRFAVAPKFLGMLRERVSEETRHLIFEEINEDLSALDAREIEAHLQRH
ncbi:host attachment protein [Paraburkholderia sp. EG304]|uniref:host attachment protein n=1 Tax=Paraburkholderia sp. EG304 TaxID=3237015 RepID=UPI00397E8610